MEIQKKSLDEFKKMMGFPKEAKIELLTNEEYEEEMKNNNSKRLLTKII